MFHTISSSSYLTLGGMPLKLVYFFGFPFSTRATLLSSSGFKKFKDPIQEISSSSLLTFFLFCLTFSESSLAITHSLTSPWHQVPDFYEPIKFCSTLVPTLGEGFIGILLGQWDGPCPNHAHILVGIERLIPMNHQGLVYVWLMVLPCLLHEALPFMSNIFMFRDTAKPFSPRTILQHTAVSRPRLTICIASTSSVRSTLSRSIDSVFFLSFRGYHDLSHTRPLESYLVRRNGKFIC